MPAYGIGFQPGAEGQQNGGTGGGQAPLESVVKLLSLRLPSVVGARGIAPQGLLSAPGMAGQAGNMGEQQWLQMLQRLLAGGGQMGAAGFPGGTAGPRVIPGTQGEGPPQSDLGPVNWADILRGKSGGNTGIGDTGRGAPGPLGPAPESGMSKDTGFMDRLFGR